MVHPLRLYKLYKHVGFVLMGEGRYPMVEGSFQEVFSAGNYNVGDVLGVVLDVKHEQIDDVNY